jgi:hypothetical protein
MPRASFYVLRAADIFNGSTLPIIPSIPSGLAFVFAKAQCLHLLCQVHKTMLDAPRMQARKSLLVVTPFKPFYSFRKVGNLLGLALFAITTSSPFPLLFFLPKGFGEYVCCLFYDP